MADASPNPPRVARPPLGLPGPRRDTRTWLQRLVMLEPGETRVFLWSAAYFFFVLFSYYLLRPVRDTIGIRGDIDRLPWLWTGTTIATLAVTPVFAWIVSRLPRRTFVPWLYRFFAVNLLAFWGLLTFIPAGPKNLAAGYAFFIWLSVFNLLSTSVFWGFMADAFTQPQSKRLFGAIGVGGTLGAMLGGLVPAMLADPRGTVSDLVRIVVPSEPTGLQDALAIVASGMIPELLTDILAPVNLILLAIVGLEIVAQCVTRLCRLFGMVAGHQPSGSTAMQRPSREPGSNVWAGFVLIAKSPYLQMMVVYMLLYTITSTLLYIEQLTVVKEQIESEATRTRLFAWIDVIVNALTLLTQLFLTGRILTRLGVLAGLLLLPLLTLIGFLVLWRWELLAILLGFQILRRSMHYAVDRPTREVLYTVLSPDAKYKSKAFIDTVVYRAGDLIGAWGKALGNQHAVAVGLMGAVAAGVWCGSAAVLGTMQRRIARRAAEAGGEANGTTAGAPLHSGSSSADR